MILPPQMRRYCPDQPPFLPFLVRARLGFNFQSCLAAAFRTHCILSYSPANSHPTSKSGQIRQQMSNSKCLRNHLHQRHSRAEAALGGASMKASSLLDSSRDPRAARLALVSFDHLPLSGRRRTTSRLAKIFLRRTFPQHLLSKLLYFLVSRDTKTYFYDSPGLPVGISRARPDRDTWPLRPNEYGYIPAAHVYLITERKNPLSWTQRLPNQTTRAEAALCWISRGTSIVLTKSSSAPFLLIHFGMSMISSS